MSCWATSLGVYWSLRAKVPSLIWSSFNALSVASFAACDFLNQTHKLSTEQSYSPHTKPPAGNDNLISFGLAWPVFFSFLTWFWYLILHIAVLPLCLLFHWFLRGVSSASVFPALFFTVLTSCVWDHTFLNKNPNLLSVFFWWPDKNVSKIQFSHLSLNSPWCDKMINVASRRALAQPMTPLTHQSSCTSIHHLCDMVLPPPPR